MKKMQTLFLAFLITIISIGNSPITSNAQNNNEYSKKYEDVSFIGRVIPARSFYIGEESNNNDYIIFGSFISEDGDIIPSHEWKVFAFEGIGKNTINVTISHMPSMSEETDILYNDIKYTVNVSSKKFSSKLRVNFTKNIKAKSIDDAFKKLKFYNSLGCKVSGDIEYNDNVKIVDDKAIIKYKFSPHNKHVFTNYGYETYDIYKGEVVVKIIK